jgi:hypothetical protein
MRSLRVIDRAIHRRDRTTQRIVLTGETMRQIERV